ncbi:bifunctional diguanylate cyclase/phosphodiesterase [Paucibacter sp. R3-3]|uniref:Bifunctional diguanylate cyclase/phosphodiesterase n=1 Tax=Roseateles agri TaxID=3098619 RepID=A0ABU5DTC6_9BURK|nr:bifunctional diguanylate cyclase/phosphodiesterase [Paucibacter sp. R3-3]MDY0749085.1 bifunctional diguanylate cyclase/phosphodiesterase [Paucibacter sp. R3-3]
MQPIRSVAIPHAADPIGSHGTLPVVSRRYRRLVYSLLGSLITIGIILSLVMAWSSADIRRSATPLLREQVPELRQLADLEAALLRHQLILNNYFAGSIDRDDFLVGEMQARLQLIRLFEQLVVPLNATGQLAPVNGNVVELAQLADEFKRVDREALRRTAHPREILMQLNAVVKALQEELSVTRRELETNLYRGSDRTVAAIDKITLLIFGFAGLTVLTSGFMLYHARARFNSEGRLAFQAAHDPLTGLAHRRALEHRLGARGSSGKVLVLGLVDRFDRIVGGLGHARGDELLQALAQRLIKVAADFEGQAFSLDGPTVALLFERDSLESCADYAVEQLRRQMAEAFILDGHEVFIDLTLGYACEDSGEAQGEPLLRRAGAALQSAMRIGGGSVVGYSSMLQTLSLARLDMETDLRHALEREELELFYQPQLDLPTGRLSGFEALVRWRRSGRLVSPADFIPIAEESGLIIPIGDWILEEACRQARRWNEPNMHQGLPVTVAVNLSMRQFRKTQFIESIEQSLRRSEVNPTHIELELTESAAMHNPDQVLQLLQRLRGMGLALAIDDFGTGYSSLAYLQRFPLDKLKIDQSFVRELSRGDDAAAKRNAENIVRAMITLGHQLNLRVIAEGVETEEQMHQLVQLGCDAIQGYLYGRPVPAVMAQEFLLRERLSHLARHDATLLSGPPH